MHRCLQLAALGAGHVAPNPMVGAVLVFNDRIIGEGWHQRYGEAHAEVNCINQALEAGHSELLNKSVIYVSLEPCAHFGKTPPCADLIIKHKIPKVVIGCRDPFDQVNGKGIEKLMAAGLSVQTGVLEEECKELNKRFFTFHIHHRPYIILKWAQTSDGFIASNDTSQRLFISNDYSNRLVHRWRSEEAAILVGTNTALLDDPSLTNRLWGGKSPVRMVIDRQLKLPPSLKLFDHQSPTIVFNTVKDDHVENLQFLRLLDSPSLIGQVVEAIHGVNIQSVIVEGGMKLLQSFITQGLWDEARVIYGDKNIGMGLPAPELTDVVIQSEADMLSDKIKIFKKK